MDNKKRIFFLFVMLTAIMMLVFTAYSAAPPKAQKADCNDCDTEQATVLEGTIAQIDQSSAKSVTILLEELSNVDCANQIANGLANLGNIGNIKCDLNLKTFEVQYSPDKVTVDQILNAFVQAEHPGKIVN